MHRCPRSYSIRHPERRGKDVEATRRSCEKFRAHPTTIVNPVEGSRFTETRKHETRSPYDSLLPPRAADIAMALNMLDSQFDKLLNVMPYCPENNIEPFYDMLSGRLTCVVVHVNLVPIGEELHGDYVSDKNFKRGFQRWLNGLWEKKGRQLTDIMRGKERQSLSEQLR